jgi:hypothetical protein
LVASLAQRLTQARRIIVDDTSPDRFSAEAGVPAQVAVLAGGAGVPAQAAVPVQAGVQAQATVPVQAGVPTQAGVPASDAQRPATERFVGQLSTSAIQAVIGPEASQLLAFEKRCRSVRRDQSLETEIRELLGSGTWRSAHLPKKNGQGRSHH